MRFLIYGAAVLLVLVAAFAEPAKRAECECSCIPADAVEETPRAVMDAWFATQQKGD